MRNRFQTIHIILHFLGLLLILLSAILLVPLLVLFINSEYNHGARTLFAFLMPSLLSLSVGLLCRFLCRAANPNKTQAMLVCSLGWLLFSAVGALPYVIGINASYLDGFFEAMSGFTTTGITMFTGLDGFPRSILFWRSLTQWVGGLGILTFFLVITYRSGAGAHSLFGAESHKIGTDRPVPGLFNTLKTLWAIYTIFTCFIVFGLLLAQLSLFDSVCHSFTALSTGGFSPYDASIQHYQLSGHPNFIWIEYILVIGMLMGGTNFLIHYRILNRDWRALFDSTEMKYWWTLIGIFVAIIFFERLVKFEVTGQLFTNGGILSTIESNFRAVLFQVVSIITTTGFATQDIGSAFFGQLARQLFLVMMVIGGCVGSTGGGFKVFRISILTRIIQREVLQLRRPSRSVSTIIIDGKPVTTNEIYRVSGLFFAWIALLVLGGGITALLSQLGAYEAFSGMFSALGNIGPCYIPVNVMGQLNPAIKITYIFGMLAGRLEILPVLLLVSRRAWRE
jgi:trk system potassium uptake protein TrkH